MLKAYLHGVWDSIKGTALIFIVIKDTSSNALQQAKQPSDSQPVSGERTHRSGNAASKNSSRKEISKFDELVDDSV